MLSFAVASWSRMAAVLWYRPGARRSKREGMTTTLCSRTTSESAAVEGPGMDSAVEKRAWSSRWQKYCARKSSGRQMSFAPASAASRTRATALARFASVEGSQDIWMRATRVAMSDLLRLDDADVRKALVEPAPFWIAI